MSTSEKPQIVIIHSTLRSDTFSTFQFIKKTPNKLVRQLIGYLLEKDKGWTQTDKDLQQEKKDSPRQISATLEKYLKENEVNAVNSANETLLHIAAAHGHTEIIDYLISKGAKLEVKDQKERTPLHRAAKEGHGKAVNMLLQAGADMYTLAQEGKTPLHLGHTEVAQKLLQNKAKVNLKDKQSKTPLHLGAEKGHIALVELLLGSNADPNSADKEKKTPLHLASIGTGHFNCVNTLVNWPLVHCPYIPGSDPKLSALNWIM
uniref:CARD- and ANK-containing Inflammasome Adaptor Protein n=1 Tax=Anolis carolinensis TaxID=28377 RepID=A0A803THB7_ANOCA